MRSTALLLSLVVALASGGRAQESINGVWRAWLDSPGGELPFGLELYGSEGKRFATIINGSERIEVGATFVDGTLSIEFPHYDSRITARASEEGARLDGTWRKRRGPDTWLEMSFHAARGVPWRFAFEAPPTDLGLMEVLHLGADLDHWTAGRYAAKFSSSEDPAVAIFEEGGDGLRGTFLTTTGDYRFLEGRSLPVQVGAGWEHRIALSCFDGAHAFLFKAKLTQTKPHAAAHDDDLLLAWSAKLEGDFWSGDKWHETWTATTDATAALPDAFTLAKASGAVSLNDLVFPDLDGTPRRLADAQFAGKARILEVFGSWCPNCADAATELKQLEQQYGPRGLKVVGLAFEVTGDFERDAAQVRRYAERHGITWPLLVAGVSDKDKATASLGLLDRVVAYPTLIFLDEAGAVRAVYTGFSGPATGEAYEKQHAEFVRVLEELLGG